MPKFITKDRWLTPYALACGYIETAPSDRYSISLYDNGGGAYDVKLFDRKVSERLYWETYETLTLARATFNALCRRHNLKRRLNNG